MMVSSRFDDECPGVCNMTTHIKCQLNSFPRELYLSLKFESEKFWEGAQGSQNEILHSEHWDLRVGSATLLVGEAG